MVKPYKKIIFLSLLICAVLTFGFGLKASAFNLFGSNCKGDGTVQGGNSGASPVCTSSNGAQGDDNHHNVVLRTINDAANIIAVLAGVLAVIMIIVAGFSYVTAGGNAEQTKGARGRIIYASVGLVIIAMAWTITRFITDKILS
jgi:hypothetical protein